MVTFFVFVSGRTSGGGIFSSGSLQLTRCTLRNNTATSGGGGLYSTSRGPTTLTNCTLTNNQAESYGGGIAVDTNGPPLTLTNVTITANKVTTAGFGNGGVRELIWFRRHFAAPWFAVT